MIIMFTRYLPLQGYTYGKEFIASQGPLPGTANDFWRMVWEQSVSIVVMLTKCKENNMVGLSNSVQAQ